MAPAMDPIRMPRPCRLSSAALVALLAIGCDGGTDDDDAAVGTDPLEVPSADAAVPLPPPDAYLAGGAVCDAGSAPDAPTGLDGIDCDAPPRTDLPGPGLPSTGEGTLRVDGRMFSIDALVRADFLADPAAAGPRPAVRLLLHDGETRTLETVGPGGARRTDYGAYGAAVALEMALVAGPAGFSGARFEVLPGAGADDPALAGEGFSTGGALALHGGAAPDGGPAPLDGGSLTWLDAGDGVVSLTFELVLADGRAVGGSYLGRYATVR